MGGAKAGTSSGPGLTRRRLGLLALAAPLVSWTTARAEGDGTADAEAGGAETGGAAAAPESAPGAAPEPPRDPNVGPVTNLPLPRYVSLKTGQGNARRGPGLTHKIDWVFTRAGMPLKVTAEYEHWRKVEDQDGAGGWVHYSLLSGARAVLVTTDMAEFHADPSPDAEVLFQAELNVVGKLLACSENWARVSVGGEKGWAKKSELWGVDPGEVFG